VKRGTWRLKVVKELKTWSEQVLEKPSSHFNNLPPCPFARKAWAQKRVKIDFGGPEDINKWTSKWPPHVDLLIVVAEDWDCSEISSWCDRENSRLLDKDLTLMAFIPGDEGEDTGQPEEETSNWDYLIDDPYPMVFIQKLSHLNAASEMLERRGYYKNCTAGFLGYIKERRERSNNARKQEEDVKEEGCQEVEWIG
jgi:hypothetical protein